MDDMDAWGALLTLVIAAVFAWHGVQGLRTGVVRIPVQFFFADEYQHGETMFGLIVSLNFIGASAALMLSYVIWSGAL